MPYILIDLERSIGTGSVHFWKANRYGYTRAHGEAGRFTEKQAAEIVANDFDENTVAVKVEQFEKSLKKFGEI